MQHSLTMLAFNFLNFQETCSIVNGCVPRNVMKKFFKLASRRCYTYSGIPPNSISMWSCINLFLTSLLPPSISNVENHICK